MRVTAAKGQFEEARERRRREIDAAPERERALEGEKSRRASRR